MDGLYDHCSCMGCTPLFVCTNQKIKTIGCAVMNKPDSVCKAEKFIKMEYADLLKKYDVPVPRYTSYPTVPFWKSSIDPDQWKLSFKEQFHICNGTGGISLYIHLPFCESLCTYCGCNKKITTNHSVELKYIAAVLKEWQLLSLIHI